MSKSDSQMYLNKTATALEPSAGWFKLWLFEGFHYDCLSLSIAVMPTNLLQKCCEPFYFAGLP